MDWTLAFHVCLGALLVGLVLAIVDLLYLLAERRSEVAQLRQCLTLAQHEIEQRKEGQAALYESLQAERRVKDEKIAELDRHERASMTLNEAGLQHDKKVKRERELLEAERDQARQAVANAHEKLRVQAARFERLGRIIDSVGGEVDALHRIALEGAAEEQPQPVGKDAGDKEIPF